MKKTNVVECFRAANFCQESKIVFCEFLLAFLHDDNNAVLLLRLRHGFVQLVNKIAPRRIFFVDEPWL